MGDYKLGQTVQSQDGRVGVIRFMGKAQFAAGEWLGLELADSTGKNDGSVKGERYFECEPCHGIFIRKEAVVKIVKQPSPAAAGARTASSTKPANGVTTKSRPSSVVTTEVARKRQSLMSAGSTLGSRLSTRVRLQHWTRCKQSCAD